MAGWALVLAIVPCGIGWLVSIGLAITVLVRSRNGHNHGKGLAIAALVIAPLWIIASIALGVVSAFTADAERDGSGRVTERDDVSVFKLREGDCFDQPALFGRDDNREVATADAGVMPCSQPHQFEAYLVFDLPDGDYPGEEQVDRLASRRCIEKFADFVGVPYGKSRLEPYVLYPQQNSWRLLDDREVLCMVGEPGRLTTGSLRGSRR